MFSKNTRIVVLLIFLSGLFVVFQGCKDNNDVEPDAKNQSYLKADVEGVAWNSDEQGGMFAVLKMGEDSAVGVYLIGMTTGGKDTSIIFLTMVINKASSIQEITEKPLSFYTNEATVDGNSVGALIYSKDYRDTASYMSTVTAQTDNGIAGTVTFHYSTKNSQRILSGEFHGKTQTFPIYPTKEASITNGKFRINLDKPVDQQRIQEILEQLGLD